MRTDKRYMLQACSPTVQCACAICSAVTENTRASYPIEHIDNAKVPCVGGHPKNLILLCCDAFGVLPPVSRLTTEQAMYHFISGYTAKVPPGLRRLSACMCRALVGIQVDSSAVGEAFKGSRLPLVKPV